MMLSSDTKTLVLLVEDEFLIRMCATEMLEEAGFRVVDISILFTDINMPGSLNGFELAKRVHEKRPSVQIILTSGRIQGVTTLPVPGSTFIGKPYGSAEILRAINTIGRC
jgi:CheY-like chemotaxis protein